jgi:hypothetical protein
MLRLPPRPDQKIGVSPPRRRRWWRWAVGIVLTAVVITPAVIIVGVKLQSSLPPLALPVTAAAPMQSLDVSANPDATVTLFAPVPLPPVFSSGAIVTESARALLTLNGVTRPVAVTLSARRDGAMIEAAGALPVAFANFGIKGPAGYGIFGSLAADGTAEFLLVLAPTSTS